MTTEVYSLSLHDALPISQSGLENTCGTETRVPERRFGRTTDGIQYRRQQVPTDRAGQLPNSAGLRPLHFDPRRSEEHTSELQSLTNLVCSLLLEKNKNPF